MLHADKDIVFHRHVREEPDILESPAQALGDDDVRRCARDVLSIKDDLSFVRRIESGQQVDDGRLAGSIGADQRSDLSFFHRETEIVYSDQSAETDRQVFDF